MSGETADQDGMGMATVHIQSQHDRADQSYLFEKLLEAITQRDVGALDAAADTLLTRIRKACDADDRATASLLYVALSEALSLGIKACQQGGQQVHVRPH